jgi:hypothetical protein
MPGGGFEGLSGKNNLKMRQLIIENFDCSKLTIAPIVLIDLNPFFARQGIKLNRK